MDEARTRIGVAGWHGRTLGVQELLGHTVVPVVELTGSQNRCEAGEGPELSLTTLSLWEQWGDELQAPPAPLRIIGFVSCARTWRSGLRAAVDLRGLGPVLIYRQRPVSTNLLLQAEETGAWVVAGDELALRGRPGAVATAVRTPAHRWFEESLFSRALREGSLAIQP